MPRLALRHALLLGLAACGGSTATPDAGPSVDSPSLAPLCTATLSVTGTFNPTTPPNTPAPGSGGGGCQPAGGLSNGDSGTASATWTVNVTTSDMGNCSSVDVQQQYVFDVTQTIDGSNGQSGHDTMITLEGDANDPNVNLTIGGDDDQCTGNFAIVKKVANNYEQVSLKVKTAMFTTGFNDNLTGDGEYDLLPPGFGSN